MSIVFDTTLTAHQAALFGLRDAVDSGAPLLSGIDAADRAIQLSERLRRLSAVAAVDTMQAVDDSRVFIDQGHASARAMVAHLAGISNSDAFRLDKIRRLTHNRSAETIATAWRAGELGIDQTMLLAKVYANPRVRDRFVDDQEWFLAQATKLSWPRFEKRIARWMQLADDDGTEPAPDPTHQTRDATMAQDHFSQAWHLRAQLGSIAGSRFNEIFNAYLDAEYTLDRERARELHGPAATRDDLARTDAQRRADALAQIAEDATHNAKPSVRTKRVHNIVWQGETAEELFRRHFGIAAGPLDPDNYRITDLDGNPLHGHAAMADLVTSSFRRVIQNAASVTIDITKDQRFFTGLARLGVELQTNHCYWPGCHKPTTRCQIDHLRPAARSGRTEQSNGAPACQRHNLIKEAGYTVTRKPDGTMHITTPNGNTVR